MVLALLLVAACVEQPVEVAQRESAIVGGTTAHPGEWPDAVAVIGSSGSCSGTLIAPDVVLSAGHCAGIAPVAIVANTVDFASNDGDRERVASTVAYPSWQTSYDVSVIVLAAPIANVTPRKIGTHCTFHNFTRNTPVHLVGFGRTDKYGQTANTLLREALTEVTDPECTGGNGCEKAVAPGGEFVAGGSGDADSCFGDSGGPVYLDTPRGPVVIGAVSRGVANANTPCGDGGIYVRTDPVVEWIEQTTGKDIATDNCVDDPYTNSVGDDDGGCAASHGSGLGVLGAVWLVLRRRRVSA